MEKASLFASVAVIIAAPAVAQQAPSTTSASAATDDAQGNDVIVTGTRATGLTAAESAAPIKLVGADAISHVGQPNLNQVLTQLVPSFTAESVGGDTANLTLSAALRGLSPNATLVLVNGKRRHVSSNLHVLGSPFQGSAAPDLDFITPASIDHIEVLEDGASAQYGSDAVAGVINIILKKSAGGSLSGTAGQYYAGDGLTYSTSLNYGLVMDRGYLNLTGFYRYTDYTQRGDGDVRVTNPDGTINASKTGAIAAAYAALPGFPRVNPVVGSPRSKFAVASYNAGYNITDAIQFYGFGSIGFRNAAAYENVRLPDRANSVASATTGVAGNYNAAIAAGTPQYIFSQSGFRPQEAFTELDYQAAAGLKGEVSGVKWDLSTTYGADRNKVFTQNSKNLSLWVDHLNESFAPLNYSDAAQHNTYTFYDGTFRASEWTTDLDLAYQLGTLGTLAGGAEYRRDGYRIKPGEPASYYKTAAQSFAGYTPANSGNYHRDNYAIYADVALAPVQGLKLDGAVRYEHFSDFGSKTTWKATGRYDFNDMFAIRGTAATGFRAPTLAEEHYSGLNVAPGYNYVQIPPNSAAAAALGIPPLRPETSTNYSIGTVIRPIPRLTITIDVYQIRIKDRILGSGNIQGYSNGTTINPNVLNALISQAGGRQNVDFTVGNQGILVFTNGGTTRTRGVDFVASYATDVGPGHATFTLSANYNKTNVEKVNPTPTSISSYGQTLFDQTALGYITTAPVRVKVIGGINYSIGKIDIVARETYYGREYLVDGDSGAYVYTSVKPTGITDLEVDFNATKRIVFGVGANNLFDRRPEVYPGGNNPANGGAVYNTPIGYSPYGINGGYYYGRVSVKF